MILFLSIIGMSTFVGIIANILINRGNAIYKVIGIVFIVIIGVLACFVGLFPSFFGSYQDLIIFLVVIAVLFIIIYIGTHLTVSIRIVKNDPDAAAIIEPDNKKIYKNSLNVSTYRINQGKPNGTTEMERMRMGIDLPEIKVRSLKGTVDNQSFARENYSKQTAAQEEEPAVPDVIPDDAGQSEAYGAAEETAMQEEVPAVPDVIPDDAGQSEAYGAAEETAAQEEEPAVPDVTQGDAGQSEAYGAAEETAIQEEEPAVPDVTQDDAGQSEAYGVAEETAAQEEEPAVPDVIPDDAAQSEAYGAAEAEDKTPGKYTAIISKAYELAKQQKYLYAITLLETCLLGIEDKAIQRKADILLLEFLVLSNQYERAQKKWLDILNKNYEFEASDKIKLKNIMTTLKNKKI